jgi:serine/threonine-protein kinase
LRIGDYEIRREIGRGGMGIVYLAQDVKLGRFAALKALPTIAARDQTLLGRLRHEAEAAAAVSHPGVATICAFIESPHGNFIASEYIQGRTLREELKRGPMDPTRAVRLTIEIAEALCAAHDAQIIHRDLKPENVMVTPSGAVKIIDFGIARIDNLDGRRTSQFMLVGTIGYMAPEQFFPEPIVDHRADLRTRRPACRDGARWPPVHVRHRPSARGVASHYGPMS